MRTRMTRIVRWIPSGDWVEVDHLRVAEDLIENLSNLHNNAAEEHKHSVSRYCCCC